MTKNRIKWIVHFLFLALVAVPVSGIAKELNRPGGKLTQKTSQRAPASMQNGSTEVDKPLKVQGQSRNLSMMLIRKNEKDKIKFGEIRENYRQEVMKTHF